MKKFYLILAAALISICAFASKDVIPSNEILADYYDQGQVCVCFFVPADMACNDIVLTGSFNGWKSNAAECVKVEPVEGFDGWYVGAFDPENEPEPEKGIQAKPIMLDVDGNFNWDYQVGAATVIRGGVQVVQGVFAGEIDLNNYGNDYPNVFTVDAWKKNPCTAVYHNYTITVISNGCNGYVVPFLVGAMNGWTFQQMQLDAAKTIEYQVPTYSISFKAAEETQYQIVSGLMDESGDIIEQPQWSDISYMQKLVDGEWVRIPGENNENQLTHENANILWDLRADNLRWARCDESPLEHVVLYVRFPSKNLPAEGVEIIGTFDEWQGTAMEWNASNNYWFVELEAKAADYFKFRSAGSWEQELYWYDAEDDLWVKILDEQLKFGHLWYDGSYKGDDCKIIELDLSDPDLFRWTEIETPIVTNPTLCDVNYYDNDKKLLIGEAVILNVPEAPEIEGFTFVGWETEITYLHDGIKLHAVYEANEPTNAPAVYVNPANRAQKLIREGNVYILRDEKTYTIQGQKVK